MNVLFRLMTLIVTLLFAFAPFQPALYAQDEIEQIINRDPFDPDRGVKEEKQVEAPPPEPEEVVNEEHNMVLDGTIMFSKSQMAIITIDKPAVATASTRNSRIRRVTNRNRRAPIQRGGARLGAGDPEEEDANRPTGPETHTVYVGDEVEGYKLTGVTNQTATLKKGNETIELRLFSGEKENRGGSKEMNAVARPADAVDNATRPRAQRIPGGDPNPRATEADKKNDEPPMKVPDQKFEKRERPKIKRSGSSSNFKM